MKVGQIVVWAIVVALVVAAAAFFLRERAARTPAEALRLAHEHPGPIHLLLSDVVMPGMNGRDLARTLGDLRPGLRVLFMSGYTNDVIATLGRLDGELPFLRKPFSRDELAAKIREVLAT